MRKAAVARFEKVCRDALIEAKLDRAAELMAQYQPSAGEMAGRCAEAGAAYAARNPHKKQEALGADERGLYKGEAKITKPADRFVDAAPGSTFEAHCRVSEAAYAATLLIRSQCFWDVVEIRVSTIRSSP